MTEKLFAIDVWAEAQRLRRSCPSIALAGMKENDDCGKAGAPLCRQFNPGLFENFPVFNALDGGGGGN
ncbi:hypothetical protein ACWJKU_11080 [Methylocaldum sp. MU1018]